MPAAIILVALTTFIFPAAAPKGKLHQGIIAMLGRIQPPWWMGGTCAALMVAGISALDYFAGGLRVGGEFNLHLIPIFLASLLFGLPVGIVTWLFSFLAVYFSVISPRDSFAIGSLKDFADMISFFYLGLIILAIPVLIRASSVAGKGP
jgi:K+-sensing histidine kinase KdpD